MNRDEYLYILSERSQLLSMIEQMPEDDVISRMSLEYRLNQLNEEIEHSNINNYSPAKATLTFRGDPVIGTYGISSNFGSKIVRAFNGAITTIAKAISPVAENFKIEPLIITGTAKGSFGFVLEEASKLQQLDFDEESIISKSLIKAYRILNSAILSDDDELSDEIDDIDEASIRKLRGFIELLLKEKATFTLNSSDFSLVIRNPQQLESINQRLSIDNIKEEIKDINVIFEGVLPNKRQCEFKIISNSDEETFIEVAKISQHINHPEVINKLLGKKVKAKFLCTTVGNGKVKYSLRYIFVS